MSECASRRVWCGPERDGIQDHSALGALDAVHLLRLTLDGHVSCGLPPCRPHGRWPSPIRDSVTVSHRGGEDRNRQRDADRDLGMDDRIAGVDRRMPRNEQDVIRR